MDIAQTNFNSNPNNESILSGFVLAAQKAEKDIQYKYKEFWTTPEDKIAMAQAKEAAETAAAEKKE